MEITFDVTLNVVDATFSSCYERVFSFELNEFDLGPSVENRLFDSCHVVVVVMLWKRMRFLFNRVQTNSLLTMIFVNDLRAFLLHHQQHQKF